MPMRRRGFTMIELMVVIAVIAILMALLLPGVQTAREAARRVTCRNNLKQIALALNLYHESAQVFPFGCQPGDSAGADRRLTMNWRYDILPFIDQQNMYKALSAVPRDVGAVGNEDQWLALPAQQIPLSLFICPTEPGDLRTSANPNGGDTVCPTISAMASYVGNAGTCGPTPASGATSPLALSGLKWLNQGFYCDAPPGGTGGGDGMLHHYEDSINLKDVRDGVSQTLLVGEKTAAKFVNSPSCASEGTNYMCWMGQWGAVASVTHGVNFPCRTGFATGIQFGSMHPGGAFFGYVDGSVHFLSDYIDLAVLRGMATRAGKEVVPDAPN